MSKWALIKNGSVDEVVDVDPSGRYHSDIVCVLLDADREKIIREGDSWSAENGFDVDEAEINARAAQYLAATAKETGELYADTGITVPFTSQDAVGLLQIKAAFEMGATSTVMHFSNGQKLPLTPATFTAFAVWFTQNRNSFYLD